MKIATFPDLFGTGWDGTGTPDGFGGASLETIEEFAAPRDSDEMSVAYLVPGDDTFPLINLGALAVLKEAGQEPLLHWVVLDLDNEGHLRWAAPTDATFALVMATTATGMGGYTTRAGLRLMAPLDPPLPVSLANSFLEQFGAALPRLALDIDESSYQWTRRMRLPRAKRDGKVLDPFIMLDNLTPIDPHSFGFTLEEQQSQEVGDWGDAPPEPVTLTWEDWQHSIDMPWTTRGAPVPAGDAGASYFTAKTALARIAARSKCEDPHVLASYLWESVLRTGGSSLGIAELWKMAKWTVDRQAESNAAEEEQGVEYVAVWPEGTATSDEWLIAKGALSGSKSRTYASLKDSLPLHSSKAKYEEYAYRALRNLAEGTDLPADSLFRLVRASVEVQKTPHLEELWTKAQELVVERDDDASGQDDRYQKAFINQFPLTLACPTPSTPLFQLDTTTTPYSYKVTSETLIDLDYETFTAPGLPFEAFYDGLKVRSILKNYGGRVESTCYESGTEGCRYDKAQSLISIGVHKLVACTPRYHPEIAAWLELLGASDPQGLKDWLACVTYTTDQPLCSVYIEGASGIGKSLLGNGIASLWRHPPVDYNKAMVANFNFELTKCPLLFADEGVVVDNKNRSSAAIVFRDVISTTSHRIEPKNINPLMLRGALRVLICANDDRGLPFKDSLGSDGIDAIVQRVLYLKADPAAKQYLETLGGRAGMGAKWAPDDNSPGYIAEHLLWLRDNHQVTPVEGGRFLVVGKPTSWHAEFGARQGIKPNVLRVIYAYVQDARAGAASHDTLVKDDQGAETVWVHPTTVLNGWEKYAKGYPAKPAHIKDALRQVASVKAAVKSFSGKSRRVVGVPYQVFIDAGVCEVDDLYNVNLEEG